MIVVGGSMRSGTTVLQSVLCSTSSTNPVNRECDFLIELAALYQRNKAMFDERGLQAYFGTPSLLRDYMRESTVRFLAVTHARYPEASQLVLKNPELTVFFPILHELLPEARFVVSVRDPRDTVVSILNVQKRYRDQGKVSAYDFHGSAAKAAYYVMAVYQPVIECLDAVATFGDRILFVRYEDLCADPEGVAEGLSGFTGIDLSSYAPEANWHASVEFTADSPWRSEGYGKGIARRTSGSFPDHLGRAAISQVEEQCAALMDRFGYAPYGR